MLFKYTNFFIDNINVIFGTDIFVEQIVLPLGISFYTFQQIAFLADVYRGELGEERIDFVDYAEFVSFFPQLIAGPIVSHDLIPQFKDLSKRSIDYDNVARGLVLFTIGLFKKVIIADTFAQAVAWGFSNIPSMNSIEAFIVMISYTFQIYFDFSGYSDMAIGLAGLFNIKLPVNFDSPYKSYDIIEFWQRWHMTLTGFLHKYIYIPLGGNRKGVIRTYINIFIVFLISGFWHGANWTFVLWGIIHGIANILNRIFKKQWDKLHPAFKWGCTFLFINVTWLIFRADSIAQAGQIIAKVFSMNFGEINLELKAAVSLIEFEVILHDFAKNNFIYVFVIVSLFLVMNLRPYYEKNFKPNILNMFGCLVLFVWTVLSLAGRTEFIYFGF